MRNFVPDQMVGARKSGAEVQNSLLQKETATFEVFWDTYIKGHYSFGSEMGGNSSHGLQEAIGTPPGPPESHKK